MSVNEVDPLSLVDLTEVGKGEEKGRKSDVHVVRWYRGNREVVGFESRREVADPSSLAVRVRDQDDLCFL